MPCQQTLKIGQMIPCKQATLQQSRPPTAIQDFRQPAGKQSGSQEVLAGCGNFSIMPGQ